MSSIWTKGPRGTYTTEVSTLSVNDQRNFRCPGCGQRSEKQCVKVDYDASGEDIYGKHFLCACGARMLIIND